MRALGERQRLGAAGGVIGGLARLSSIVFFLAMTALSLFFLLKDGPPIRAWAEGHLGLPMPVAQTITQRVLGRCAATSSA